jgi:hypothetical protein
MVFLAVLKSPRNHYVHLANSASHGIINRIDTKAKCRLHLKLFTCKGTLRQVFIGVYRLEIQSVTLVLSAQFCELLLF